MRTKSNTQWKQGFSNYRKALSQLNKFINKEQLNEFEEQSLFQEFVYTYELACNLLIDYLYERQTPNIHSARDAIRVAYSLDLIEDGDSWMDMNKNLTQSSHIHNQNAAKLMAANITKNFLRLFEKFEDKMQSLYDTN